jgi:hypothetical protein
VDDDVEPLMARASGIRTVDSQEKPLNSNAVRRHIESCCELIVVVAPPEDPSRREPDNDPD